MCIYRRSILTESTQSQHFSLVFKTGNYKIGLYTFIVRSQSECSIDKSRGVLWGLFSGGIWKGVWPGGWGAILSVGGQCYWLNQGRVTGEGSVRGVWKRGIQRRHAH